MWKTSKKKQIKGEKRGRKKTPPSPPPKPVIDQHIIKERAIPIPTITEKEFESCNQENIDMIKEFLRNNRQLSPETIDQYFICLRQFFWYIKNNARNKPYYKISKRDFIGYLSWMQERGLSSSAIKLRKASVSSFCNYIENVVADDLDECKYFRNFTRGMPKVNKTQTYEKIPISKDEYNKIMSVLEERENYLGMAWVSTAYNIGGRRAEIVQLKTEILDYPVKEGRNYVVSHIVRGKGSGIEGKPLRYMIPLEVLDYWRLWINSRGYKSEWIFTTMNNGVVERLGKNWSTMFCHNTLSKILGRRVYPHLFKTSCITRMLEDGKDIKLVSKYIGHHEDVSTTLHWYDMRSFDDELDDLFDGLD